jgi:hypothetical protein
VASFMQMMIAGKNSYWEWSCSLGLLLGYTISKQAIFGRMNKAWIDTVRALVKETIGTALKKNIRHSLFDGFGHVWLQDSTCMQLPAVLFEKYRCKIMNGKKKSVAKINLIINILDNYCPMMEWTSFTVSESTLSWRIMEVAKAGDLVIRDLGYFTLAVFKSMNNNGIYFLSRLRYKVNIYDLQGKEMNLHTLLGNRAWADTKVLCGGKHQMKVRLVAVRLSEEQVSERRRKAKKAKSSGTRHDKAYIESLAYIVFITNVDKDKWTYKEVAEAYRIRWNIEILFKSWKSGLQIQQVIPEDRTNTERVESILYMLLLYLSWFCMLVYEPLRLALQKKGKHLSIIKMAKWIKNPVWWNGEIKNLENVK